ncbi:DUF3987 domain-containing protein [Actinophytocola sediminis]
MNGPVNSPVTGRRLYPVTTDTVATDPGTDNNGVPVPGDLVARMAAQTEQARAWLPPVDPAVFDCYLGTLATAIDPYTEADPVGVLASLLAAAGVHIGPDAHLPLGMERHPLVVWPLLIGHTGSGKKGTAWGATKTVLTAADTEFVACNIHSGLSSGEGLATVFATDDTDNDTGGSARRSRPARLLPDGDLRLLAYEPEWASVMARMKREGNTLSATLRAAWEGGNLSTLNVDARVARRGHVGILAHITPGEFKAKVSTSDMAGGTYNRFLPIAVAQSKFLHLPTTPTPELLTELGTALAHRLDQAGDVTAVQFAPGTEHLWAALYLEFATTTGTGPAAERLTEFTSRAAPHCLRVAALYAALDGSHLIQPGHLAAAAALIRYSLASAAAVLRPAGHLVALAAWLTDAGDQGRTREQVRSDFYGRNKSAAEVSALLDELTAAGRITVTKRAPAGGRGKPAEVYTANPNAVNAVTR